VSRPRRHNFNIYCREKLELVCHVSVYIRLVRTETSVGEACNLLHASGGKERGTVATDISVIQTVRTCAYVYMSVGPM
jgi:hypothetical protein